LYWRRAFASSLIAPKGHSRRSACTGAALKEETRVGCRPLADGAPHGRLPPGWLYVTAPQASAGASGIHRRAKGRPRQTRRCAGLIRKADEMGVRKPYLRAGRSGLAVGQIEDLGAFVNLSSSTLRAASARRPELSLEHRNWLSRNSRMAGPSRSWEPCRWQARRGPR
jgi:hypothetical protein